MQRFWWRHGREDALRSQPERQAQLADRLGAFGPLWRGPQQRIEIGLIVKPRQRVIGLRLQKTGLNAPLTGGQELRHAPSVQQIGHQRGDKHGFACTAEPCHPEADDPIRKTTGHRPNCAARSIAQAICH